MASTLGMYILGCQLKTFKPVGAVQCSCCAQFNSPGDFGKRTVVPGTDNVGRKVNGWTAILKLIFLWEQHFPRTVYGQVRQAHAETRLPRRGESEIGGVKHRWSVNTVVLALCHCVLYLHLMYINFHTRQLIDRTNAYVGFKARPVWLLMNLSINADFWHISQKWCTGQGHNPNTKLWNDVSQLPRSLSLLFLKWLRCHFCSHCWFEVCCGLQPRALWEHLHCFESYERAQWRINFLRMFTAPH